MKIRIVILVIFYNIINSFIFAQENDIDSLLNVFKKDTNLTNLSEPTYPIFLDLGVSANAYSGDLSSYAKWTACYHIGLTFNKNEKLNGRLNVSFGFITGENRTYTFQGISNEPAKPNRFFSTSLLDISYSLRYHFIKTKRLALYISQGFGIMQFTPKDENGRRLADLLDSRPFDENYGNITMVLPTSLGINYWLKNGYGIGLQAGFVNPQTNYLDNIGQWGNKAGNDQIFQLRFFVLAPLKIIPPTKMPKQFMKRNFTHSSIEED
jgi:hypothetical protein